MIVLFAPVDTVVPARCPTAVLFAPEAAERAPYPTAVEYELLSPRDRFPTATFCIPVVRPMPEATPTAVFQSPVVR
jgi:hypothetical protein